MTMLENDFKRWFRKKWREERGGGCGWTSTQEYARGGDPGAPDINVLIGNDLVPIEMKTATIKVDKLLLDDVRPAQIQWHFLFNRAGGTSAFLIGVITPDRKGWLPFITAPSNVQSKNPKIPISSSGPTISVKNKKIIAASGPAIPLRHDELFSQNLSDHLSALRMLTIERLSK